MESRIEDRDRLRFNVIITVYQAGLNIAELGFSFTAYRKKYLVIKEHEKAVEAFDAFFQNVVPSPLDSPRVLATAEPTRTLSEHVQ